MENKNTFKNEFILIENNILNYLGEVNIKENKDIIIIIDFNLYEQEENNKIGNNIIDSFINQTKIILNDYLSDNDRLSLFIYKSQYQIICPLLEKNKIDFESFSKDLIYYKKNIFNEMDEDEYNSINELKENDLVKVNLEYELDNKNLSESENEESFDKDNKIKTGDYIKGLIDTINYTKTYLKIKEINEHEKYIILFTDIFNTYNITDEIINMNFNNLKEEKDITFLLVGKNKGNHVKINKSRIFDSNEEKKMMKKIVEKFGDRSELIDFENMKKIQNILSNNDVIKDEIIYTNEIYK